MMTKEILAARAKTVADFLVKEFGKSIKKSEVGIILGTGFGDRLPITDIIGKIFFQDVEGYPTPPPLEGHARQYLFGKCAGKQVAVMSGRVHMYETAHNYAMFWLVRTQVETLLQLGIKRFIITCATGALPKTGICTGDLILIDGLVTVFAPQMPLFSDEFVSPEDIIDTEWRLRAEESLKAIYPQGVYSKGHVMVTGPYFEGRKYDKKFLAMSGASIVGMSLLPEANVISLYPGTSILGLSFVTNDSEEKHLHETNLERARQNADSLSLCLEKAIEII